MIYLHCYQFQIINKLGENKIFRYTMYDQRYQAIGLPVDPHLRIFNAINGQGKSGYYFIFFS